MMRLLRENTFPLGELEMDKIARSLLNYWNTPCKYLGLSPAQIIFVRQLRDHLSSTVMGLCQRWEWILTKEACERVLVRRHAHIGNKLHRHTMMLLELEFGDIVQIQN